MKIKKSKFRAFYNFNGYPGQYFYFKDLDSFIKWVIPRIPRKIPIQLQVLNRWNNYINVPKSEWANSQLNLFTPSKENGPNDQQRLHS